MAPETAAASTYELTEVAMRLGRAARAQTRLHSTLSAGDGIALEKPAVSILGLLNRTERSPRVGEIAAELGVEGPHVTRHVKKLESEGLVRRIPDPTDRRACEIQLTDAGLAIWERYCERVRAWMAEALESWTEEDRQTLGRLLERYVDDITAKLRDG